MITQKQIQKLTDIVVRETDAEAVYLFGSIAGGGANENSDVDLLVVLKEELRKEKRRRIASALGVKTALPDLFFPKDFKLYSISEFNNLRRDKYSFLYNILQTAKTLYVRQ